MDKEFDKIAEQWSMSRLASWASDPEFILEQLENSIVDKKTDDPILKSFSKYRKDLLAATHNAAAQGYQPYLLKDPSWLVRGTICSNYSSWSNREFQLRAYLTDLKKEKAFYKIAKKLTKPIKRERNVLQPIVSSDLIFVCQSPLIEYSISEFCTIEGRIFWHQAGEPDIELIAKHCRKILAQFKK